MNLKRIVYNDLVADLKRKEIGIIVGPRQVGKTTLLKALAAHCRKNKERHRYFDLEMPIDAHFFARDFKDILSDIKKEKGVIFIDEFHYLPNATKLFKAIHDGLRGVKIYASGSSAIEMHRHLKESLAGRRRLYQLFPLSFSEWLPSKAKTIKLPTGIYSKISSQAHRAFKKYLGEFIIFGGMPGLVHEKDIKAKKRLLLDLIATYIQKDIKALLREEDIFSFNRLLSLLASQEGGLLSENSVSGSLNYSLRQVRKDLAILNQMFLLDILNPFFTNRGRELKQINKIYYFDTGIYNAILRDFRLLNQRPDKGALLESFVLHEMQKNLHIGQEIYYWRTREKDEVDFILVQDRIPIAIEVKSKLHTTKISQGMNRFFKRYPECKKAVILNDDLYKIITDQKREIAFIPHYYAHLLPLLYQ
ncbi:MAG: ATP-binding protein [Candidatus Omnitrophica bacterium]|nr:ATP-binding protein [Candidatus Omnitrophota bacterium]MBU0897460.1 ATP-binding protein [Candidatus Omnitrophota bacterium]MBU1134816.1 ATP-binding protein [Candidatus Omnitrophota bacterium]MBU1810571.1 ATP-binding protein [Candidatus Omnitrophota bacterium]